VAFVYPCCRSEKKERKNVSCAITVRQTSTALMPLFSSRSASVRQLFLPAWLCCKPAKLSSLTRSAPSLPICIQSDVTWYCNHHNNFKRKPGWSFITAAAGFKIERSQRYTLRPRTWTGTAASSECPDDRSTIASA